MHIKKRTIAVIILSALIVAVIILQMPKRAIELMNSIDTIKECIVLEDYGQDSRSFRLSEESIQLLMESFSSTEIQFAGRYHEIPFPENGRPLYRLFLSDQDGRTISIVISEQKLYYGNNCYRMDKAEDSTALIYQFLYHY